MTPSMYHTDIHFEHASELCHKTSHVFTLHHLAPPKACFCGRRRTNHPELIFVVLVHIKEGGRPCCGWTRRLREGADLPRNHDICLPADLPRTCTPLCKVVQGPASQMIKF